jgi:ribosomal protein S27AE
MPDDAEGGDQVCWLDRLCPECGAMPTADPPGEPGQCWRCGAEVQAREPGM